jgi:hypothetical protein
MLNPLGTKGQLAAAFASILHDMWKQEQTFLVPTTFRVRLIYLVFFPTLTCTATACYHHPRHTVRRHRTARLSGIPELLVGRLARRFEPDPEEAELHAHA